MTNYEKVLEIKSKLKDEINETSTYFLYDIASTNNFKFKSNLKKIMFKIDFKSEINKNSDIYMTNYIDSLKREDHSNSNQKILKLVNSKYEIQYDNVNFYKIDLNFIYNIVFALKKAYVINKKLKNVIQSLNIGFCLLELIRNEKIIKSRLEKILPEVIITFCDILPIENQIALIGKKLGIKTVTLQHGQYFYYKGKDKPIHSILYSDTISDYFLAWGEYTLKQALKENIKIDGFIKVGSLKNIHTTEINSNLEIADKNKKIIGIILDNNAGKESNINMISLINEFSKCYNYKYIIRYHPTNIIEDYQKIIDSNYFIKSVKNISDKDYLEMVNFSISHLSSVPIELMKYNHKTFIFKDIHSNVDLDMNVLEFKDIVELDLKLREIDKINIRTLYNNFVESPQKTAENYLIALKKIINIKEKE
ncbi:MAG: hypothetical protein ACRCZI_09515 [Cetobacterium sp.]